MNKMIHINYDVNEWCVYAAAAAAAAICMLETKQRNGKTPQKKNAQRKLSSAKCLCAYAGKDGQRQNRRERERETQNY